jgi:hypothetical protein
MPTPVQRDKAKVGDQNAAPTTTAADDLRTAGQRKINAIWEYTQAAMAVIVVGSVVGVSAFRAVKVPSDSLAFEFMSNVAFMVITFYFSRTNHTRVGGVHKGQTGR